MAKALNMNDLSPERKAELAEQRKRHDADAERWRELFEAVGERVLTPSMTEIADELARTDRWVDAPPTTEARLSGSGVKSSGQFRVPGSVEGETRPVTMTVELFPTTGDRFIAHLDVGGKVERHTFEAADFRSDETRDQADARFRAWLNSQFDKHIRRRAR